MLLVEILDKEGDCSLTPKDIYCLAKNKLGFITSQPCWSVLIRFPSFREDLAALVRSAKNRAKQRMAKDNQDLTILPDVIESLKE